MMPTIKLEKVHARALQPVKGTIGAACFDLFAVMDCEIKPGEVVQLSTGWKVEVPPDHALMVYSRSGQGFKNKVTLVNGTGVIDSDYRGPLMVGLRNDGSETYYQPYGKAIAQAMLVYVPFTTLEVTEKLSETERGANGFGSTDSKHCDKAVEGYECSRAKHHEGPCAAFLESGPDMDGIATPKGPEPSPIMPSRHLK